VATSSVKVWNVRDRVELTDAHILRIARNCCVSMWGGQRTIVELDDEDGAVRQKCGNGNKNIMEMLFKWQEMPIFSQENLISRGNTLLFERKTVSLQSEIFAIIPTVIKSISICKTL